MTSLIKTYSEDKLKGRVYTPHFIVEKMLDEIEFYGDNVLNKRILDPACGNGNFLIEVVKRILKYAQKNELEKQLQNVYGWDIDHVAVAECINNLNKLVSPYHLHIQWNIHVKNSLYEIDHFRSDTLFSKKSDKFDTIVGNPPYIRIQHLDYNQRQYIKKHYSFCKKGSTDIFIAFFELCFNLLSEKGIGILITPNTYFYTQTARAFREFIKQHQNIKKITNYKHLQLFEGVTTYCCITTFTKQKHDYLVYEEYKTPSNSTVKIIPYDRLRASDVFNFNYVHIKRKGRKLKDICKIGVGVTILSDKSYIFPIVKKIDNHLVLVKTHYRGIIPIELQILKPIIKGSTYKGDEGHPKEWILFPYHKVDGKFKTIPEDMLRNNFPLAYQYLLSIKEILDKRDGGKPNPVAWYAFGRHQSLDSAFGKKIIFPPISKKPNFILSELEECTLYSGYFIKYDGDYHKLLNELNSKRMEEYIHAHSRDFRNGWKAYNKKVLENFEVFI
jgi:methylase of polypeptide subunit release factors